MAMQFISRATLPVVGRGRVGGPRVSITDKGQVTLSSRASIVFEGIKAIAVAYDKAKRVISFLAGTPTVVKLAGGDANLVVLRWGETHKVCFFSAAPYFAEGGPFSDYSYKASGNQGFDAVVDEKNKSISFTLPEGSLAKKPTVRRKPRVKKDTTQVELSLAEVPQAEELLLPA